MMNVPPQVEGRMDLLQTGLCVLMLEGPKLPSQKPTTLGQGINQASMSII
jgi:hypothetical protein